MVGIDEYSINDWWRLRRRDHGGPLMHRPSDGKLPTSPRWCRVCCHIYKNFEHIFVYEGKYGRK